MDSARSFDEPPSPVGPAAGPFVGVLERYKKSTGFSRVAAGGAPASQGRSPARRGRNDAGYSGRLVDDPPGADHLDERLSSPEVARALDESTVLVLRRV
jgi:hypothetical protein